MKNLVRSCSQLKETGAEFYLNIHLSGFLTCFILIVNINFEDIYSN